jgi:hypothetical protein
VSVARREDLEIGYANVTAGFEGEAHPYGKNLLKVGGQASIADLPEVQAGL